jgi:hypothetical protein
MEGLEHGIRVSHGDRCEAGRRARLSFNVWRGTAGPAELALRDHGWHQWPGTPGRHQQPDPLGGLVRAQD